MSTSIIVTSQVQTSGGPPYLQEPLTRTTLSMAGVQVEIGTMQVTSTPTAIPLPAALTDPGIWWLQNIDPTNAIQIGVFISGTFHALFQMLAGDPPALPGRLFITNPYAYAPTGTPEMEYGVLEM